MRESISLGVLAFLLTACGKDPELQEIERAMAERPRDQGVPTAAIGGGIDPATSLPVGYPPSLPIVPGFEILSGGVEPGAIRTTTLEYDGMTVDGYRDALAAAMQALGQRIERDDPTPNGGRRLRLGIGERRATAVVTPGQGDVRVDFMMVDRAPTP